MRSHQFLDLALIVAHEGLKVSRFQDDTTSDQDNVVAAGQERNAVCDKDPSFGREQSARTDDMIYEGSITWVTSTRVRYRLTVNMTCNVGIDSGQHIVQQYQVRASVNSTGKGDSGSLTTAQLLCMSITCRQSQIGYAP